MANLLNLTAEVGANFIGDDTGGASGSGLSQITFSSSASAGLAVNFSKTVVGSPTVAVVALDIASTASAPVFELRNQSFVSATTILFTTGATSGVGAIGVKYGDNYGWIPILPTGSVTGAAR